ncbi:B4GALT3 [Cordylochernes scorpioides]|uniref:B4GALT3 n=1 Tax=Cordylochernes scorpioides TaxID=51811 RepID=A0ABY6KG58_9ARAC|nr:B4GALT3 [Cordylochernes scorpioides]
MELIRVHIPRVRPFVRCTLRRALRLMPSFLLLLFVFSLIFVTLMQIAVIHVHRRGTPGAPPRTGSRRQPQLLRTPRRGPGPRAHPPDRNVPCGGSH